VERKGKRNGIADMKRFAIIDTETGGLDPNKYSLLSVGVVVWDRRAIVDELEIAVAEAEIFTEPEAMAVNRCDLDWIRRNGQCPAAAVATLEEFLRLHFDVGREQIRVAGHNVGFDLAFIKRIYRLADRQPGIFSHRVLDTASIIQFLSLAGRLPLQDASSDQAFEYFGIRFEDRFRHTALGDARATAALLTKLLDLVESH
jgi:DNA polymerase-3 subunit epsilon